MRQNDPCQEGGRAPARHFSRCLMRLMQGLCVIDGSVTAGNGSRLDRTIWRAADVLRRHWVLVLLLVVGVVLRAMAQIGYEPALLFIDSKKYIFGTTSDYNAWGSYDPIGYTLMVLRPVLMFADLAFVALLQHVLGLAMAVALYVLMLRRGVSSWLAALAVAPVLLDAYQLNAEQTIMPDVLFEALLVAGIVLLLWKPQARARLRDAGRARARRVGARPPGGRGADRARAGLRAGRHPGLADQAAPRRGPDLLLRDTGRGVHGLLRRHPALRLRAVEHGRRVPVRPGRARRRLRHAEAPRRRAAAVPHRGRSGQVRRRRPGQLPARTARRVHAGQRPARPADQHDADAARARVQRDQAAAAAGDR